MFNIAPYNLIYLGLVSGGLGLLSSWRSLRLHINKIKRKNKGTKRTHPTNDRGQGAVIPEVKFTGLMAFLKVKTFPNYEGISFSKRLYHQESLGALDD